MPRGPTRLRQRQRSRSRSIGAASPRRDHNSGSFRSDLAQKLKNKPEKQLTDSDDSDLLVTKGHGFKRGSNTHFQQIYASGAVGAGDEPGDHPSSETARAQRRRMTSRASTSAVKDNINAATASKPVQPVIRQPSSAQPTPSRDPSILEGIKPRRRQPSILRATDFDDSLLNDDFELPDDESTPLNPLRAAIQKQTPTLLTPNHTTTTDSASRKRKLGSSGPVPASTIAPTALKASKPTPERTPTIATKSTTSAEPSLPRIPPTVSQLRATAQSHHRTSLSTSDIMAPPLSGSSSDHAPSSPLRAPPPPARKRRKVQAQSQSQGPAMSTTMNTHQLQALMPTKKGKTWREVSRGLGKSRKGQEFEIPSDPIEDGSSAQGHGDHENDDEDESSFLPAARRLRTTTKGGKLGPANTGAKHPLPSQAPRKASVKANTAKKRSKAAAAAEPPLSLSSSSATTKSTQPLSPSTRSTRNRGQRNGAKSLLQHQQQQHPSSKPQTSDTAKAASSKATVQHGGSPLKTSTTTIVTTTSINSDSTNIREDGVGKENTPQHNDPNFDAGDDDAGFKAKPPKQKARSSKVTKKKSYWDDIDAFELAVDEVSPPESSFGDTAR